MVTLPRPVDAPFPGTSPGGAYGALSWVGHDSLRQSRRWFWDNNGRCCGTAGVLALACDRQVTRGDGLDFADVLMPDLADRATRDDQGARWCNVEYRDDPPDLEPHHGCVMGNTGIVRELLRHARLAAGKDPSYAVDWPDHPPASTR